MEKKRSKEKLVPRLMLAKVEALFTLENNGDIIPAAKIESLTNQPPEPFFRPSKIFRGALQRVQLKYHQTTAKLLPESYKRSSHSFLAPSHANQRLA